jgi:hypothetical protein
MVQRSAFIELPAHLWGGGGMVIMMQLPLSHPRFEQEVLEQTWKPNGYIQVGATQDQSHVVAQGAPLECRI